MYIINIHVFVISCISQFCVITLSQYTVTFVNLYTYTFTLWAIKTCHFTLDYNFRVSWWISTLCTNDLLI